MLLFHIFKLLGRHKDDKAYDFQRSMYQLNLFNASPERTTATD